MTSFSSPNSRVPALTICGHVAVVRRGYCCFQQPQHVRAHMWSPVEAYPIVADRELKSLTANPLFQHGQVTLLSTPAPSLSWIMIGSPRTSPVSMRWLLSALRRHTAFTISLPSTRGVSMTAAPCPNPFIAERTVRNHYSMGCWQGRDLGGDNFAPDNRAATELPVSSFL